MTRELESMPQKISMPKRNPTDGTFELTIRCNLHCKMCLFRHDDKENSQLIANELTAKQWIDMAKQAAEAGTISLLITGGEPMLRPDFCEIWEGIYKLGFLITLYTNATLVTPQIMKVLQKYPPHKIGITIYGASSDTYAKVCGNDDAFNKMLAGAKQLNTLPSIKEYRTTIIKDNYDDLDDICNLVAKEFGENYKVIQTRIVTQSVRGACSDVNKCRLDPEDNVKLAFHRGIKIIREFIGNSYDEKNLYATMKTDKQDNVFKPRASLFGCDAGMQSYTVSWDGKLLGCQMMGNFYENVLEKSFKQAWSDFPKHVKLPPINEKCRNCTSQNICNCCCASRYAETGDLGGWPEYVCRDTAIINNLLKRREKK